MRALGSKQELIASFITRDLDTRRRASITHANGETGRTWPVSVTLEAVF